MTKQGLILAAGLGKRMAPLSNNLSKSLLPVAGRPFIEWQITACIQSGVERIGIVCRRENEDFQKSRISNFNGPMWTEKLPLSDAYYIWAHCALKNGALHSP